MLGIGLVFNLVLVIAHCALVRVRNWYGLQYSVPDNTLCVRNWFGFQFSIGNNILCVS